MSNFKYTAEVINKINSLRAKGSTWKEVTAELNELYDVKLTASTVRNSYYYNADKVTLDELDSERQTLQAVRSQVAASDARKKAKNVAKLVISQEDMLDTIRKCTNDIAKRKIPTIKLAKSTKKKGKMTVEALFSDLQIGKLTPDFNKDVAKKRIEAYTKALLFKINQHLETGYDVEKIVLCLLGDIIESEEKAAQKGQARSCDLSTGEQMHLAMQYIHQLVLIPLMGTGIKLHVICVPGNHDHTGPGMNNFQPGKTQLSWGIYQALAYMCGDKATFDITEGVFTTYDYYGQVALYEHGYGVAAQEKALYSRVVDRIRQIQQYVTYYRMGDKHQINRFNEDTLVINGAFFGSKPFDKGEEYSSVMGYSSRAGQIVFFHVPRNRKGDDDRLTIYDSFIIQLSHIN